MNLKHVKLFPSNDQKDHILLNIRKINNRRNFFNMIIKKSFLYTTKKLNPEFNSSFERHFFQLFVDFFSKCSKINKNNQMTELQEIADRLSKPNKFQHLCENHFTPTNLNLNENQILKFSKNLIDFHILTDLVKCWKNVAIFGSKFPYIELNYAQYNLDSTCIELNDVIPILGGISILNSKKISIEPTKVFFITKTDNEYSIVVKTNGIFYS